MDLKTLKSNITTEMIKNLINHFGGECFSDDGKILIFNTVCHGGDSHKLFYYIEDRTFNCYTRCGVFDVITLIEKLKDCDTGEAIRFINNFFGFTTEVGFNFMEEDVLTDLEVFESLTTKEVNDITNLDILDSNILNLYRQAYHRSFIEDNISIATMKKFGLRFDVSNYRIIIPHFDMNNNLISIRCRNLEEELVSKGLKYVPLKFEKVFLAAPTSHYFFGLNFNMEAIKKAKKVIIVESEKAVMQLDSILDENISVALSGSFLSNIHIQILKDLGVTTIILALDKEFEIYDSLEEKDQAKKMKKFYIDRLRNDFSIEILWDKNSYLNYKDSPTDNGKQTFLNLYNERIVIC